MEEASFATENYFVAFIDILGYREKINKLPKEEQKAFIKSLNDLFELAKDLNKSSNMPDSSHGLYGKDERFDIKMKTFSDNIFLYTKANWTGLLLTVTHMQANCAFLDISIRGALSHGELFANDDFIYGSGLIEAYDLERKAAIFPRIIVGDSFVEAMKCCIIIADVTEKYRHLKPDAKSIDHVTFYQTFRESIYFDIFFANDIFDESLFINYLAYWKWHIDVEGHSEEKPSFEEYMKIHKEKIEKSLTESDKPDIAQKYKWCKFYHNSICGKNQLADMKIPIRNRDTENPTMPLNKIIVAELQQGTSSSEKPMEGMSFA